MTQPTIKENKTEQIEEEEILKDWRTFKRGKLRRMRILNGLIKIGEDTSLNAKDRVEALKLAALSDEYLHARMSIAYSRPSEKKYKSQSSKKGRAAWEDELVEARKREDERIEVNKEIEENERLELKKEIEEEEGETEEEDGDEPSLYEVKTPRIPEEEVINDEKEKERARAIFASYEGKN